jgi:hypothetical protein
VGKKSEGRKRVAEGPKEVGIKREGRIVRKKRKGRKRICGESEGGGVQGY